MSLEDVIAEALQGMSASQYDPERWEAAGVVAAAQSGVIADRIRAWALDDDQVERARDAVFVASCSDGDIPVAALRALFGEEEG